MPSRSRRKPVVEDFPDHDVTAVLVVHDGLDWLADCLDALRRQRRPPDRIVAVDTGSADGSYDVLRGELGDKAVVRVARDTSLARAVAAGLAAAATSDRPDEQVRWVWLVHDDCAAEPDALYELLAEADRSRSSTVLGPKLLSYDGRHLLEVGVSVDASGARRTIVEAGEVDQGQHDHVGDVLAVSTAAMLVRRDVWDRLDGLDPTWPVVGDDVDFGWRANAAGERVVVASRAVVRHAAALTTGGRRAAMLDGRPAAAARMHGRQVVLANTSPWLVPLLVMRYALEAPLSALVALLARRPREAADELAATAALLRRPGVVTAARRRRRATRLRSYRDTRHLLARSGGHSGRLSDAFGALGARGGTDAGSWRRLLVRPPVALTLVLLGFGLLVSRDVVGGHLHGGRLLPSPTGATDLWSSFTSGWHPVGVGSTTAAPPWLALLALLATLLLGKAWLAVSVLFVGVVPLAGLSAYAALGAVTRSVPVRVWLAFAYAVTPVVSGALAGGRLDVVVAVVVLPLLARAVGAALVAAAPATHLVIGAGLLLAVVAAFAPAMWAVVGLAAVVVSVVAVRPSGPAVARSLLLLVVAAVVLLPWSWQLFVHPSLALRVPGLPDTFAGRHPQGVGDLLLLHPGGPGQPPLWVAAGYVVAAIVGLSRTRLHPIARAGAAVFVVGVGAALAASRMSGVQPGIADSRWWTGPALAVATVGALASVAVAADGADVALRRYSFGWRQSAAALLALVAIAGTGTTAGWWFARGAGGPLSSGDPQVLPLFASAEVASPTTPRVVVLRVRDGVVRYALLRTPSGPRLGDADLARGADARASRALAGAVQQLVAGDGSAVAALARFGVTTLVAPNADARSLPGLGRVDGLTRVPTPSAVVWRLRPPAGELVVASAPSGPPVAVLHASAGSARVAVPRAGGRLLLAEPASSHWQARLNGRPLDAVPDGWAQAWRLPAGGGRLEVRRVGDHRAGWLWLELVLVVGALLVAVQARRSATPNGDGVTR